MIFIDTSVWVQFFRGKDSVLIQELRLLLDRDVAALSVVSWLELLSGVRAQEKPRLSRVLSALPRYFPKEKTWLRVESWIEEGVRKGQRFSATDLMIASIAVDQEGLIWSLDSDYARMENLGFIRRYRVGG